MANNNVKIIEGNVVSIGPNAFCTSDIIEQEAEDSDFESLREIKAQFVLKNVCSDTSDVGSCVVMGGLETGDRLFYRKNDNTVVEQIIEDGDVLIASPLVIPKMLSASETWAEVTSGNWNLLGNGVGIARYSMLEETLKFNTFGDLINLKYVKLSGQDMHPSENSDFNITLKGSLDGVNWSVIDYDKNIAPVDVSNGILFPLLSPGNFQYFALFIYKKYAAYSISNFKVQFYDEIMSEVNCTDTMGLEIPSTVYKFNEKVEVNGEQLTENNVTKIYGFTGESLQVNVNYNDYLITGRSLQTKIYLTSSGNEFREIYGQIFKV